MSEMPAYSRSVPCRASRVPHWDGEADVIVVGFGAAGACAAIESARAGARVMLLEMTSGSGGTTALSGGEIYMGGNGGTQVLEPAMDALERVAQEMSSPPRRCTRILQGPYPRKC